MRWIIGIAVAAAAFVILAPVLVLLFLIPVRSETGPLDGYDNRVPFDLRALTVHDRLAIQLTWTPVNQGTATYVLQRSENGEDGSWQEVAVLEPGSASYLDQGLQDGVTYLYRIRAFDPDGGSGYSNVASAIATDLPRPQSSALSAPSSSRI